MEDKDFTPGTSVYKQAALKELIRKSKERRLGDQESSILSDPSLTKEEKMEKISEYYRSGKKE